MLAASNGDSLEHCTIAFSHLPLMAYGHYELLFSSNTVSTQYQHSTGPTG